MEDVFGIEIYKNEKLLEKLKHDVVVLRENLRVTGGDRVSKIAALSEEVERLEGELAEQQATSERLQVSLTAEETRNAQVSKDIAQKEALIGEIQENLVTERATSVQLRTDFQLKIDDIAALQTQLDQTMAEKATVQSQLGAALAANVDLTNSAPTEIVRTSKLAVLISVIIGVLVGAGAMWWCLSH